MSKGPWRRVRHFCGEGRTMPAQLVALSDGPNILLTSPSSARPARRVRHQLTAKVSRAMLRAGEHVSGRSRPRQHQRYPINGVRSGGPVKPGDELTVGNRYHVTLDDQPPPAATPRTCRPAQKLSGPLFPSCRRVAHRHELTRTISWNCATIRSCSVKSGRKDAVPEPSLAVHVPPALPENVTERRLPRGITPTQPSP